MCIAVAGRQETERVPVWKLQSSVQRGCMMQPSRCNRGEFGKMKSKWDVKSGVPRSHGPIVFVSVCYSTEQARQEAN